MFTSKKRISTLFASFLFIFQIFILPEENSALAQSPVPEGAALEWVAGGFSFLEGPYWNPEGYLVFSDIPANTIFKWSEEAGTEVFLTPSGNSNGLSADLDGNLLLCQHSERRLARLESDKSQTPLATHFNNKRLHSPNDLAVKTDGSIFFTDPPWGGNPEELSFHGVFRIPPGGGDPQLLVDNLNYPNGIVFSPDESRLYVDNSHKKEVFVYDVVDDTILANGRLFVTLNGNESADGMKVDASGNLYVTGSVGIAIYSPDGNLLDEVSVPGQTTNLGWGDEDGLTLYITSGSNLYRLRIGESASVSGKGSSSVIPSNFQLMQNYPNPFNPTTTIGYQVQENSRIKIGIYDNLGREIKSVLNAYQTQGDYQIVFNGEGLPGGTYYFRLLANDYSEEKKMVLIK